MKQLDLFNIGTEDRGYISPYKNEPHTYIVEHVAKTGRTYKVFYARRDAKQALKEWCTYPSKLLVVW
jgi:hypothetical protein